MSDDDLIVRIEHLYSVPNFNGRVGFCGRGARAWCKARGIDWRSFVKNGVPASVLVATGDAMALRVVEHAREVINGQG